MPALQQASILAPTSAFAAIELVLAAAANDFAEADAVTARLLSALA